MSSYNGIFKRAYTCMGVFPEGLHPYVCVFLEGLYYIHMSSVVSGDGDMYKVIV